MKNLILGTSILMAVIGCTNNPTKDIDIDLDKVITLSYQQALKKDNVACIEDPSISENVDVNFGCVYKSENFYVILNNNSEHTLEDIKIVSSNSSFVVSPSSITSIGAPDKVTNITPILKFSTKHRTPIIGIAEENAMTRGANVTTINISGYVNDEYFSIDYVIGVTAKTMELEVVGDSCYLTGPVYLPDESYVDNYSHLGEIRENGTECYVALYRSNNTVPLATHGNDIELCAHQSESDVFKYCKTINTVTP